MQTIYKLYSEIPEICIKYIYIYTNDRVLTRFFELYGVSIIDADVKNIKDLISLTLLDLSQNSNLTGKTLELVSGLTALISFNVSNSCSTNVSATKLKKIQLAALPNMLFV